MAQFKVGQRITCINGAGFARPYGEQVPVVGQTYTVRQVEGSCVRLKEIINPPHEYVSGTMECSFKASRFKRGR